MSIAAPSAATARKGRYPVRWATLTAGLLAVGGLGIVFGLRLDQGTQLAETPLLGKPAPDFDLSGLEGERLRLDDYAGRPVVINFWASWCIPCRDEAPRLESFWQRHTEEGVMVIGIVWNDTAAAARAFRAEFHLTFPQGIDADSAASIDYGVRGVPETYIIGPDGLVMAKVIGAVGPTTLDDLLADVLAGRTRSERNEGDYRTEPPD